MKIITLLITGSIFLFLNLYLVHQFFNSWKHYTSLFEKLRKERFLKDKEVLDRMTYDTWMITLYIISFICMWGAAVVFFIDQYKCLSHGK